MPLALESRVEAFWIDDIPPRSVIICYQGFLDSESPKDNGCDGADAQLAGERTLQRLYHWQGGYSLRATVAKRNWWKGEEVENTLVLQEIDESLREATTTRGQEQVRLVSAQVETLTSPM